MILIIPAIIVGFSFLMIYIGYVGLKDPTTTESITDNHKIKDTNDT